MHSMNRDTWFSAWITNLETGFRGCLSLNRLPGKLSQERIYGEFFLRKCITTVDGILYVFLVDNSKKMRLISHR